MKIIYSVIVFEEEGQFVAYSPQLDLSSCGNTPEEARLMLNKAIKLFSEETKKMKTAKEVFAELGYKKEKNTWIPPQLVEISLREVA